MHDRGEAKARLLVVDDEPGILDLLSVSLRRAGFEVATAATGADALNRARTFSPHLVLLDVMLPGLDGFEVARHLRSTGHDVPVLFLTARDAVEDKVAGLTLGADDYITKPFQVQELVARIRAVLRRAARADMPVAPPSRLRYADLELDDDAHRVHKGDRRLDLSPTEFRLLRFFLQNPERVLSKRRLLEAVWDYDFGGNVNVVELYVSYLRRKIDTPSVRLLHTVRGAGYVLRAPEGAS